MDKLKDMKEEQQVHKAGRQIRDERARLKSEYGRLFEIISEILFRNDPIGINFEDNADEYDPEVGTILPKLLGCNTTSDVRRMIHGEFVQWFDAEIAGPEETYEAIAQEVWSAWQKHRARNPLA